MKSECNCALLAKGPKAMHTCMLDSYSQKGYEFAYLPWLKGEMAALYKHSVESFEQKAPNVTW